MTLRLNGVGAGLTSITGIPAARARSGSEAAGYTMFDVPTTIAFQAGRLYAVNARFGTTDPQPARYDIIKVG